MRVSLDEIEKTAARAALGAGWPLGLAEETGAAAAWLAAHGHDGAAAALAGLAGAPGPAEARPWAGGWSFPEARVVAAMPSALDLLAAGAAVCRLERPDAPLLAHGLAGRAEAALGLAVTLGWEEGGRPGDRALLVRRAPRELEGGAASGGSTPRHRGDPAASREIAGPGLEGRRTVAAAGGAVVDPRAWAALLALAARRLVPADARSRTLGAGAGGAGPEAD